MAFIRTESPDAQTGYSPTVRIRDMADNSLVVTDGAMSEVGDGAYKYDFSTAVSGHEYSIRVDFGASFTNPNSRYRWGYHKEGSAGGASAQEVWEYNIANSPSSSAGDKLNKLPVGVGILGQMGKTKFEMEKEKELLDNVKKIAGDVDELKKKETVIEREIELPDLSTPIVQKLEEIGRKMKQEIKDGVRSEVLTAVDEAVSATLERDEDESMEMEAAEAIKNAISEMESDSASKRIAELSESVAKALEENRMMKEENAKLMEKLSKLKETLA